MKPVRRTAFFIFPIINYSENTAERSGAGPEPCTIVFKIGEVALIYIIFPFHSIYTRALLIHLFPGFIYVRVGLGGPNSSQHLCRAEEERRMNIRELPNLLR